MADFNLLNIAAAPFQAGGAILINRFVKVDTTANRQVLQASAVGDKIIGVSLEAQATAGQPVGIQTASGTIAKVVAGAAVAVGDQVTTDSVGRAVTAATGNNTAGIALSPAAGAADVIEVLLSTPNTNGPTTP